VEFRSPGLRIVLLCRSVHNLDCDSQLMVAIVTEEARFRTVRLASSLTRHTPDARALRPCRFLPNLRFQPTKRS